MYSLVGSNLWINLIFSSSLRGGLARFWRYNPGTHSIAKRAYRNTVDRYIQYITHINNYVHLGMYLGNVLYCRFSVMD